MPGRILSFGDLPYEPGLPGSGLPPRSVRQPGSMLQPASILQPGLTLQPVSMLQSDSMVQPGSMLQPGSARPAGPARVSLVIARSPGLRADRGPRQLARSAAAHLPPRRR